MIRLDNVNRKIQAVLAGAVTTNQLPVTVSYSDLTTSAYTGGTTVINTNSTTPVDICAAPAASTVRDIDYISVRNSDTVPATVTIRYNDNGTLYTLFTATLAVGDILIYVHGSGVHVLDSSGAVKSTVTFAGLVVASGKTLTVSKSMTLTAADDTGVYTFPTGTKTLLATDGTGSGLTAVNAITLLTKTWAAPDAIGSGTPAAGSFTTLTASGILSTTDATDATSATAASLKTAGGISSVKGLWVGTTSRLVGNVGIGTAPITSVGLLIQPSGLVSSVQYGITAQPIFTSAATTSGKGVTAITQFADGGGVTYARATAFELQNAFKYGAGDTITDNIGLDILAMTSGGTLNIGLRTVTTNGTGKWNIYASGTAQNAFAGNVRIGSVVAPTVALDVTGAVLISTTLGVTGAVAIGNTVAAAIGIASTHKVTMVVGGTTYYLLASNV